MEPNSELTDFFSGFMASSHRMVILSGEIKQRTAQKTFDQLLRLETQSYRKENSYKPILLVISTPGGSMDATYNLGDLMSTLNSPVHGIIPDNASSAGVDLLQMCTKRMMFPNAWLFCHYTRRTYDFIFRGKSPTEMEIKAMVQALESCNEQRLELYAKRTGLSKEEVDRLLLEGEDYNDRIYSKRALEIGLIDEIIQPIKLFPAKTRKQK